MAIVINGSGTVTGISVGGLPDGIVDAGTLATNSVDSAELIDGSIDNSHMAAASLLPVIDCDADAWHYALSTSQDNSSAAIFDFGAALKTGSNITESGGVITVGTAGWYLITIDAGNNGDDTQTTEAKIRKNDSTISGTRLYWSNAAEYAGKSRTFIVEASASDTFDIYGTGYWYGAGSPTSMASWTGVRIGA